MISLFSTTKSFQGISLLLLFCTLEFLKQRCPSSAFTFPTPLSTSTSTSTRAPPPDNRWHRDYDLTWPLGMSSSSGYTPPGSSEDRQTSTTTSTQKAPLYPKAGDFVRYYDLDGGKADGQVLIGRIRFIQKQLGNKGSSNDGKGSSGWSVELSEMEDVGDGYYAEYASRKRFMKGSTYRDLADASPVSASFVRSEDAYKVPIAKATGQIIVRAEQYDLEGYEGPFSEALEIDQSVLEADSIKYNDLKKQIFRYAVIAGVVGTILADLTRSTETAAIYFAGFAASLLYLFFLSLKTDTIGTAETAFGQNVSNVRFGMPVIVLLGVALYNNINNQGLAMTTDNILDSVSGEQFGAAMIGFLTYRLPLLLVQIEGAFKDHAILPGSAGLAMKLALQSDEVALSGALSGAETATAVFLISGPQATGRSELVQKLLKQGEGQFVTPTLVDRMNDGAIFDRLEQRDEFLTVDPTKRYGLTKQAIIAAAANTGKNKDESSSPPILVVDADVELAKKLSKLSGLRLVGVWIGLGSVAEFEKRVGAMIDVGELIISEGETRESTTRSKIREIVKEIEFGISCGIFEFTIINDDLENTDKAVKQLSDAAKYVNI